MSPGMRHRIRVGQYKFPSPEWDKVTEDGKFVGVCLTYNETEHKSFGTVFRLQHFVANVNALHLSAHIIHFLTCVMSFNNDLTS